MDLLPSEEQQGIIAAVRDFLNETVPLNAVAKPLPAETDDAVWAGLAEIGVFGLGLAEEAGGVGLGLAEELLVFVEFGRALTPGPLLGTVLGAHAAVAAGRQDLAQAIVNGQLRVALAEPHLDTDATVGETVSGRFRTQDAARADWLLFITAQSAALVETSALEIVDAKSSDLMVGLGRVQASDVPAVPVPDATSLWCRGTVLVSAYQSGIAAATRDISAEYAKVREQYGKAIGKNQAIKHRCADMAVRAEAANFQTIFAALSSEPAPDVFQVSSARVVASQAARENSADNIVNHGGMGYSEETGMAHFARRTVVLDTVLGTPRWHLEELAEAKAPQW